AQSTAFGPYDEVSTKTRGTTLPRPPPRAANRSPWRGASPPRAAKQTFNRGWAGLPYARNANQAACICSTYGTRPGHHPGARWALPGIAAALPVGAAPGWTNSGRSRASSSSSSGAQCSYSFQPLDEAGPISIAALKNGRVQAADIFSSDPSI